MALNIKNAEVERLATEVAALAHETKTQAIRHALEDRKRKLTHESKDGSGTRLMAFMAREVWPNIPASERGRTLTKDEEEDLLGIGPNGV